MTDATFTNTFSVTRQVYLGWNSKTQASEYQTKNIDFGTDRDRAVAFYDAVCAALMVECVNNENFHMTRVELHMRFSPQSVSVIQEETFRKGQ